MEFDSHRTLLTTKADQAIFRYAIKKSKSEVQANQLSRRILDLMRKIINGKTCKTLIGSSLTRLIGL